ncbi:siderophore-interacting protein [Streptomyces sedi]|uniref:Siderophore-interacting protein n=1 Tax=Streptomyces sedi TaxID=555059 RepID=A0A5C4VCB0_9ACTN|nr:siderophore-interacting protein [Streptomyces sedi]TNM33527.1 siderophore-interacting protein [Streptomyces sedi]
MAARTLVTHPLVLRRVEVARTERINARTVRVTLTGEQLGAFPAAGREQPAFASPAFDDHVKLVLTDGGRIEDALPVQLPHGIEWPRAEHRLYRDYTPRRVGDGTLALDFVLGHDGPAADWAQRARAGDELWFVGPKSSTVLPKELDWIVLLGDETALPAVARFLEERPTLAPADLYLTVSHREARIDLPTRPGDRVRWIEDPEHDPALPLRLVRAHPWREGAGYVWGAGESRALLPVRRHLRNELGLTADRINITGYWHARSPEAAADPAGGLVGRPPRTADLPSDALAWFAVRAALRLPVLDTLAGAGALDVEALSVRVRVPRDRLEALLRVLVRHGLVELTDDTAALTATGEALAHDEHARERFDGFDGQLLLSLASLDETLRSGTPGWALSHGRTVHEAAAEDTELYGELVERAESLAFVLDALAADPVVAGAASVVLHGPGAAAVANTLRDRGVRAALTVTGSAEARRTLRPLVSDERVAFGGEFGEETGEPSGRFEVAVAALSLAHRTDDEARRLLARARRAAGTLLLVESPRPDELGPAAADQRLLRMALTGVPSRSPEAVAELATAAGWRLARTLPLGWGYAALVLTDDGPGRG